MNDQPLIHIAYAEDHLAVRKGIVSLIHTLGGMVVDIEADDGRALINAIENSKDLPDICILDISMHGMNGFDTLLELKKRWPGIGVLILTMFDHESYIIRMIRNGANGYLLKACDPQEIKKSIFAIYNDGMYYSETVPRSFFNDVETKHTRLSNLTATEIRVLKECCSDLSYMQIGEKMHTTARSVEGYRDSLFRKLKINSRVRLVIFAIQTGLVPLETDSSEDKRFLQKREK